MPKPKKSASSLSLLKVPTGITGFDEITEGGLPAGRPTLICGSAGCGKSMMGLEFLIRGATQFGEPGVIITFEESAQDIAKNVASLGFDLPELIAQKKIAIDHVIVERSEIEENGEYDLEGLFVRIGYLIDTVKARRVLLDTIESLFSGLSNQAILRAELRRLFGWLKERGMTTVITGERGDGQLTRQGLEEYVSDCVVLLDHRVTGQISTRRLRVVKYRGSVHGTNEYPFLIDKDGISVLPITGSAMDYTVSTERVSTGIPALDDMLGGKGLFRGSSVLLSGTSGTGKSSVAAHLVDAACKRGERCIYFSFEESPAQILRNMRSIGMHLESHVKKGLLQIHSTRPTVHGLEVHLVRMHKFVELFNPSIVVVDPISNIHSAGAGAESANMLIRLVDFLRKKNVLAFLVNLSTGGKSLESTDEGISSMVDTWMLLRDVELGGERNRLLYVLKSRGMAHSNQVREFLITSGGVQLQAAYLGPSGVLTGSARVVQEQDDLARERTLKEEIERKKLSIEHRRKAMEAEVEALRAGFYSELEEFEHTLAAHKAHLERSSMERTLLAASRRVSGDSENDAQA